MDKPISGSIHVRCLFVGYIVKLFVVEENLIYIHNVSKLYSLATGDEFSQWRYFEFIIEFVG